MISGSVSKQLHSYVILLKITIISCKLSIQEILIIECTYNKMIYFRISISDSDTVQSAKSIESVGAWEPHPMLRGGFPGGLPALRDPRWRTL